MKRMPHDTIKFGTDGIRETVGKKALTIEQLPILGFVIGQWIINQYGNNAQILIGHDTRISCSFIKSALASGLLLHPLTILDGQVLPTPAVGNLVKNTNNIKTGIIITASHNRYHDNGIKIVGSNGAKIKNKVTEIESLFSLYSTVKHDYSTPGYIEPYASAAKDYISNVCGYFSASFLSELTVAIDCAHGAFSHIAPHIFESLGAHVIAINNNPNGRNINENCGSLHTEDLVSTVKKNKADIGFAFDGDGDRIVVVSKDGIKKDGDDILALLSQHPRYDNEKTLVGTIMSNQGLTSWLEKRNKNLIRSNVGEPSVIDNLNRNKLTLGGEPSGHIVLNDYLASSDAVFTALKLLETIIKTDNWNLTTFERYPQVNVTVTVKEKISLDKPHLAQIIDKARKELVSGRLIVRYSGTEPLLRITTEDNNKEHADNVAQKIAHQMQQELC